ncbi:hypothetical protein J2Z44_004023 [Clostridium punense]|uniref:Uncharacterized protein n=1 Tax=Clostridium punense TaxID=1054297 RepID=A0ABS4K8R2_9CLOT|nr:MULTISPECIES: DUF6678 family protein [Clostridium]EQB89994.1 hypothetical protein M918_02305 [Clostridium sp. BL8]MBP2024168.1 hypothetical protein [Clostridium punense]
MSYREYNGLMNNTKWQEIRISMDNYPGTVLWRIKNIDNGLLSNWNSEWFNHFQLREYNKIQWLEIKVTSEEMKNEIIHILRKIHVPGEVLDDSIKVYGYIKNGFIDYI